MEPRHFGQTFLERPGLFPQHLRGERFGDSALRLSLAGGPYLLSGLDDVQAALLCRILADRARPVASGEHEQGGHAVEVSLLRTAPGHFLAAERLSWEVLIDVDYLAHGLRLAAHGWMARIDWSTGWRGAIWTTAREGRALSDLFENYFRVLVAYRLLATGGLLVHSAALADDGTACLFPGSSGDGKSTLSRIGLAEGLQVLSDDSNALVFDSAGAAATPWIEALPFGGDLRQRTPPLERYPLRLVAALAKGSDNRLEPIGRAAAAMLLVGCAPFVNGDPHRSARLMETASRIARRVPCARLTFTRRGGFWNLLKS